MKVLIVGATGLIGLEVIKQIYETGNHEAFAIVHDENQVRKLETVGAKQTFVVKLKEDLSQALVGVDAIIFASELDEFNLNNQGEVIKIIEAAKQYSIKHCVMLSSIGADIPEVAPDDMKQYLNERAKIDEFLRRSGITYSIIRPTRLSIEKQNKKITAKFSLDDKSQSISHEAVAKVLIESLTMIDTKNETFEITSGDKSVEEALKYIH